MIAYDLPATWDTEARATVELAVQIVGTRLAQYTGLDAAASFEAVFGLIHARFSPALKTWAHASYGVIRFRHKDYVLMPLIIHELGHIFQVRARLKPSKDLYYAKLDTRGGSLWPGMHPPGLAEYDINEKFSNLFADWVMQMLKPDAAGRALAAWMDANMGEWVAIAREGKG